MLTSIKFALPVLVSAMFLIAGVNQSGAADKEVLRFATWDGGESLEIQKGIARAFEQANPDVKVRVEAYTEGYDQKLIAAFGAGNPPDVMYMWNFPKYKTSLLSMNKLIKRDGADMGINDIPSGLINGATIDGEVYGLPVGFTTHVLWFNKEMFDAAGMSYPAAGLTWRQVHKMALKFRDKASKIYGIALPNTPDLFDFEQFFWQNGAEYISADGRKVAGYMNSAAAAEVLDEFASMVADGAAVAYGSGGINSGSGLFAGGKVAMFVSAKWDQQEFDDAGINYGTEVQPSFTGNPTHSAVNAAAISVAKDSKQQELAWKFVRFFVTPAAIEMRVNDLPVRQSLINKKKASGNKNDRAFYEMLELSTKFSPAFLKNDNWDKIGNNLSYAIEATMLGKGGAQANLDEAVKKSERFLN